MIVKKTIDVSAPLTDEQIKELEALKDRPVGFDEDCPELTESELKRFSRVSEISHAAKNKQTVTIQLSPQAFRTAESLGKGYTSILSRILENALSDKETIKHFL